MIKKLTVLFGSYYEVGGKPDITRSPALTISESAYNLMRLCHGMELTLYFCVADVKDVPTVLIEMADVVEEIKSGGERYVHKSRRGITGFVKLPT